MARGLGRVQTVILVLITYNRQPWTASDIARAIFDTPHKPFPAQATTVHRALATLQRAGLVQAASVGRVAMWSVTEIGRQLCHHSQQQTKRLAKRKSAAETEQMKHLSTHGARVKLANTLKRLGSPIESVVLDAAREVEQLRAQLARPWDDILGVAPPTKLIIEG
jgi:DNA-binding PadR family transcriptional regulator